MHSVINEKLVYLKAGFHNLSVKETYKILYREVRKDPEPEQWLPVKYKGLDFDYEISNYGKIKNKKGQELRAKLRGSRKGTYPAINLCKKGIQYTVDIHRLVALHYNENPDNKPEVNHKNIDPMIPFSTNLEWCTRSENELHKSFMTHGLPEAHCIHEDHCDGICEGCNHYEI